MPHGDGQVGVGVHQPFRDHDAVAVVIGVVAERHVEPVLHLHQVRHRPRRRAVHADLSVVVRGHEGERRVDPGVDDLQALQAVDLGDGPLIVNPRSPQGIDADIQVRVRDRPHV